MFRAMMHVTVWILLKIPNEELEGHSDCVVELYFNSMMTASLVEAIT